MKKHILFLDHDVNFSGSSVSMLISMEKFIEEGFRITLYTPKDELKLTPFSKIGVEVIKFRFPLINSLALDSHYLSAPSFGGIGGLKLLLINKLKYWLGVKLITGVITKVDPGLVYVNEHAIIQGAEAAGRLNRKCVVHLRSCFNTDRSSFHNKLIQRNINNFCSAVFAISDAERLMVDKPSGDIPDVETVWEPLFSERGSAFRDEELIRKDYFVPPGKRIILSMAGIHSIKGSLVFLKAAEIIHSLYKDVYFILSGKIYNSGTPEIENYFKVCNKIIKRLEAERSIIAAGEVSDIEELIRVSDIVTVNSTSSHYSRPVLEAWSFHKPVIASDVDHHKAVISHNTDGFLYPAQSATELARLIEELLDNPEKRKALAEAGFRNTETVYSYENTLGKIITICKNIIADSE